MEEQEVIAQSSPTFPYEGPFEDDGEPITPSDEAAIKLTSSTSSLQTGSTGDVSIKLESGNEEVNRYTLFITFNQNVLEVVDSSTMQSGIQVTFIDTFSNLQTNTANNSNGTVKISARVSGASQTINRKVAEISFRAKSSGTSIISVNKAKSSVKNDSGREVLGATKSVNFTVTGQTQTTPPATTPTYPSSKSGELPRSGIFDSLGIVGTLLGGVLLVYIGVKTFLERKRRERLDL